MHHDEGVKLMVHSSSPPKNALHMFWSCHRQTFHEVNKASGHVSQYFGETEQGLRWQTLKDGAMYQRLVVGGCQDFKV